MPTDLISPTSPHVAPYTRGKARPKELRFDRERTSGNGATRLTETKHPVGERHVLIKSPPFPTVFRMQFHRFDLNLLIALDVLLREKNITRAAEKVFVTQPAMSAALHRLREYFNDQLLVRVGRDMELSPRGQSLVEPVREALLLIQATLGTQPSFSAATTQRVFTLIVSEEAVPGLLPAILERVSSEAPGIRINVQLVSHTALTRLEYGEVDMCLSLDCLGLFEVRASSW